MMRDQANTCANCGHEESLHKMTNGYKPYGTCNFQHDLCSCSNYEPEPMRDQERTR